jgi:hypothetical protein
MRLKASWRCHFFILQFCNLSKRDFEALFKVPARYLNVTGMGSRYPYLYTPYSLVNSIIAFKFSGFTSSMDERGERV